MTCASPSSPTSTPTGTPSRRCSTPSRRPARRSCGASATSSDTAPSPTRASSWRGATRRSASPATTTWRCAASSRSTHFTRGAALADRAGRPRRSHPTASPTSRTLEPQRLDEAIGLYHACPRDPVWEYVALVAAGRAVHRRAWSTASPASATRTSRSHYTRGAGIPASGDTCPEGHDARPRRGRVAAEPGQRRAAARRRSARRLAAARHRPLDRRLPSHRVRRRGRRGRDPRRAPARLARRAARDTVSSLRRSMRLALTSVPLAVLGCVAALLVACGDEQRPAVRLRVRHPAGRAVVGADGLRERRRGTRRACGAALLRPRRGAAGRQRRPETDREPATGRADARPARERHVHADDRDAHDDPHGDHHHRADDHDRDHDDAHRADHADRPDDADGAAGHAHDAAGRRRRHRSRQRRRDPRRRQPAARPRGQSRRRLARASPETDD